MAKQIPAISVIVPVFDDATRLDLCLDALSRQSFDEQFEVIVADNASSDNPKAIVEKYPFARYVLETNPGSYAARNAALDTALAPLLAFTDSDCIPKDDWLENGVDVLRADPKSYIGGSIELFAQRPGQPTYAEVWELVAGFPQQTFMEKFHFAATANLFVSRAVMDEVGWFSGELQSSGDREWGARAHAAGFEGIYCAEIVTMHPCRSTGAELRKKMYRVHTGEIALRARNGEPALRLHDLVRSTRAIRILPQNLRKIRPNDWPTRIKCVYSAFYVSIFWMVERLRAMRSG